MRSCAAPRRRAGVRPRDAPQQRPPAAAVVRHAAALCVLPRMRLCCRGQEAALAGAIDAANAELAAAQQGAAVKRTDLAAQTRRKNNLHQQVRRAEPASLWSVRRCPSGN